MKRLIIALGVAAFATAQHSNAQSANPDTATLHFITRASIANLQEVALSRIAEHKGQRDDVKNFGSRMVADHTNTENKLLALARSGGYNVPVNATAAPVDDPLLKNAPDKDLTGCMYI
jgi:putative membrane protein